MESLDCLVYVSLLTSGGRALRLGSTQGRTRPSPRAEGTRRPPRPRLLCDALTVCHIGGGKRAPETTVVCS